jgi:hypothetical protein
MTQQYTVGELSSLLASLQPAPGELLTGTVRTLRHEVEFSPLPTLRASRTRRWNSRT